MGIVPSSPPSLRYEQALWAKGISQVAGIDEVGRGALAGPIVTAMVIFKPDHQPIAGVRDSKQLSAPQRQRLNELITSQAWSWKIGVGTIEQINAEGIIPALHSAVLNSLIEVPWEHVLMDGLPLKPLPAELEKRSSFIVKGDQLSYSIAAASIVAKVYRDHVMSKLSRTFPQYGWQTNVGYGTISHREAIAIHGISSHHRIKFIHLETDPRNPQ